MNEEQKKQYADGLAQQRVVAARMYGAMTVWVKVGDRYVSSFVKARMVEFIADYEKAHALIEESMAQAPQAALTPPGDA